MSTEEEKVCESERRSEVRLDEKDLIGWRSRVALALAARAFLSIVQGCEDALSQQRRLSASGLSLIKARSKPSSLHRWHRIILLDRAQAFKREKESSCLVEKKAYCLPPSRGHSKGKHEPTLLCLTCRLLRVDLYALICPQKRVALSAPLQTTHIRARNEALDTERSPRRIAI